VIENELVYKTYYISIVLFIIDLLMMEKQEVSTSFFVQQLFNSTVANTVGLFIGHPLETIKVRMQVDKRSFA
jgi:hypothetical protein